MAMTIGQKTKKYQNLILIFLLVLAGTGFLAKNKFILAQENPPVNEETITEQEGTGAEETVASETADSEEGTGETATEGGLSEEEQAQLQASEELIAKLNQQIDDQRKKIDALAEEIDKYKENINQTRGKASTLQNQIYLINNQIAKANLDIQAKEEEIKTTELEIEQIDLKIKEKELLITRDKNELSAFIRRLDRYDEKDYLAIILSNKSFSEFFDQVKYLESIQGDLQKALNRVQENVDALNQKKDEQNKKRDQLSELLKKLDNERYALTDQKQTKNYLIIQTQQSEKKFQILMDDLKAEQAAANSQIGALERQLRAELEKRGGAEKFNSLSDAQLIWPISGAQISAYFHDQDYPYRYLFEHSGVDLAVPSGTPVQAAEAGYVAKIGLGTRWYGNYIMIIHNNNLSTLYAHLSSVATGADQYVARGQTIGYSGNTGFSSGPHLHVEVRYNGIPVDPLSYLP